MGLAIFGVIWLFVTTSGHGSGAGAWYVVGAGVSVASVYFFVRLMRSGIIDRPEIPARMVLGTVALAFVALSVHAYLLIRASLEPRHQRVRPRTRGARSST